MFMNLNFKINIRKMTYIFSQNKHDIPFSRKYTQNVGIINIKKQLKYLQKELKKQITKLLRLTSPRSRTQNKEKLAQIKELNLEIGDTLFQFEVLHKQLLRKLSGKDAEEFQDDIKMRTKDYLEKEERDFKIDEEGDDFFR
jgi:predicted protein tyrosine phosphatase